MTAARSLPAADYDSLGEAELVVRARAGEREAFRVIIQRCNQRLFRVARAIVRDQAEAEDVVQEAYTRAFAAFSGFRGDSGVLTWLTRITLNEARGRLRQRRNMVGLDQIEAAQETSRVISFPTGQAAESPEAGAARSQIRGLLEHAIDELPEDFRLVLILRDIEGLSTEETAARLDLKPETVKTRLHRARKRLREALHQTLASTMSEAFPFLGARCARITAAVLARLAPRYGWEG